MRPTEIDVKYRRFWVPTIPSKAHLATAIKLDDNGKCYAANLALKAIEGSIRIDTVSLRGLPHQPNSEAKKDDPKQAK